MHSNHLWQQAAALAADAHAGQSRRQGTPYFSHPARVALTVAVLFGCNDPDVLAAALLHDVIEDTTIDFDDLLESFGPRVAELVSCLSKDPRLVEPKREAAYDAQLAEGPWQARLIKLADVYDNLSDAVDAASRRKVIGRAQRALALAANDAQLETARAVVSELVETVMQELGPHSMEEEGT
jgi:(p)ppGpp synthase/HD superfamily hydrolase